MTRHRSVRHLFLAGAAIVSVGATAACSDDDVSSPPTDVPDIESGADPQSELLTMDHRFAISLGGTVYRRVEVEGGAGGFAGAAPVAVPIPPTPAEWEMAELTDDGRDALLAEMDELGLLDAPPDYGDYEVSDSSTFNLTVRTDGQVYEHELYFPEEQTGERTADRARERLTTFIDFLDDIDDELDGEIGEFEPYVPSAWTTMEVRDDDVEGLPAWPFTEQPSECSDFAADDPTADGVDGASGRYRVGTQAIDVNPLLPWEHC